MDNVAPHDVHVALSHELVVPQARHVGDFHDDTTDVAACGAVTLPCTTGMAGCTACAGGIVAAGAVTPRVAPQLGQLPSSAEPIAPHTAHVQNADPD